jgi:F-type H+-transporting ATPase subunit a
MELSPDTVVLGRIGPLAISLTLVYTWAVMALLTGGSWLVTRGLTGEIRVSRWQNLLEVLLLGINNQIHAISRQEPRRFLPFIGTLFLFIAVSNVLVVVPGYHAPTGSLSTTAALALSVFVAVPLYGILGQGLRGFLKHYLQPAPIMLPFNLIGELSHTLSLAVRLFGNMMSEALVGAVFLAVVPFFLPVVMDLLALLIGLVQAYVFALLAMLYIAAAVEAHPGRAAGTSRKGGS